MRVSYVDWVSRWKSCGSDSATRDIGPDKGPGVLTGGKYSVALAVVTHGG